MGVFSQGFNKQPYTISNSMIGIMESCFAGFNYFGPFLHLNLALSPKGTYPHIR